MAQSSGHEARAGGGGGDEREQWFLLYGGLAGAAALSAGLWIMRAWIARATSLELVAAALVLLGAGVVMSVITALLLFATRVDRASEDVARALDGIAAGRLTSAIAPPRGLGREARLAGAAAAALSRLRSWLESSRSALLNIEEGLTGVHSPLPRLREAVAATSAHVAQLTRDTRFLAGAAEEHGALTQRASVLAAVIGQSNRDTAAFAERVHATIRDAAASLSECAARTAEVRGLVSRQSEDTTRCLEADRQLAEYLVVVSKNARQFKLLALHAAMEAARAGARSEEQGARSEARGAEFRVVALEVRRLAVSLGKATEDIGRTMEGARRSLHALHTAASEGERHVEAAQSTVALGVTALDHATAAASARRSDDGALAEAATELTILTSAIRERAIGSAKGTGDVADRLTTLDQSLAAADAAVRDVELALATVATSAVRARETVSGIALQAATAPTGSAKTRTPRKKRSRSHVAPRIASTLEAQA